MYRRISSPYIFACTACSAIYFGTKLYLPKTYKPYKKRACLLRIGGVIRECMFSCPNFHRVRVLISLLVLHSAPYNMAQKCTSLRPINPLKSAPVCCELMELLGYLRFPAQISIGFNVNLRTHFQQDALPRFP